tara:strand:- start:123 stop:401 length:279 start_codon:yes stop_codon:yes gene_type:complete
VKFEEDINNMTPNQLVAWFLISSYAYYVMSEPVMKDSTFDGLVKRLKACWDEIDHPHKYLITESHLNAGTGYDIKHPTIVKFATADYIREYQ